MKQSVVRTLASASIALLALAGPLACSDDATGTDRSEGDTSTQQPDTGTDTGPTDSGPTDGGPDDATDGGGDGVAQDTGNDSGMDSGTDSGGTDMGGMDSGTDGGGTKRDGGTTGRSQIASHINQVTFEDSDPNGCCRDFDGDGNDDSAMGDLIKSISNVTGFSLSDINMSTNANIGVGNLVFLIEYGTSWMNVQNDSGFDVFTHTGLVKQMPWDTDSDTVPEFRIDPVSIMGGQPRSSFGNVSVNQSTLTASNGNLFFDLIFGTTGIRSSFTLHDAQMTADVQAKKTYLGGEGEVALKNGKMSGIINDDDLFSAVNKIQSQNCSCLSGDMFGNGGSGRYTCQNSCSGGSAPFECTSIGCSSAQGIIYSEADADADGQGGNDDFTFGMKFKAQGADITGVGSP